MNFELNDVWMKIWFIYVGIGVVFVEGSHKFIDFCQ